MAPTVQLAWFWAPPPKPRAVVTVEIMDPDWRATVVEPKGPRFPPPTWGDCQTVEAKRVKLVIASGKAGRAEDVPPAPCERDRCRKNLRSDWPDATGETCTLRLAERGPMTPALIAIKIKRRQSTTEAVIRAAMRSARDAHPELRDHLETCGPGHRLRLKMLELFATPLTTAELADALGVDTIDGLHKAELDNMRRLAEIADAGDGRMALTERGWKKLASEMGDGE